MRAATVTSIGFVWTALACGSGVETVEPATGGAPSEAAPTAGAAEAPPAAAPAAAASSKLPALKLDEGPREPDCQIEDPGSWAPLLAAAQPEASAPLVVRGKHGVAETVTFPDGVEVRVERGGCFHAGETWSIAPAPAAPEIAALRGRLQRLALRDPAEQPNLTACLLDEFEGSEGGFGCGEVAYIARERAGDVLSFTWSFAL